MSENNIVLIAGEDLTDDEGKAIKLDGSYHAVIATGITDVIVGVLQRGAASGGEVVVDLPGSVSAVRLAGTVYRGQQLEILAAATFQLSQTSTAKECAIALQNGVSGDLCPALVTRFRINA